jgi:hypothetical protein
MSPSFHLKKKTVTVSETLCSIAIYISGRWTNSKNPVILRSLSVSDQTLRWSWHCPYFLIKRSISTRAPAALTVEILGYLQSKYDKWVNRTSKRRNLLIFHSQLLKNVLHSIVNNARRLTIIHIFVYFHCIVAGGSVIGWGTMLQAGRSRVRFPIS